VNVPSLVYTKECLVVRFIAQVLDDAFSYKHAVLSGMGVGIFLDFL